MPLDLQTGTHRQRITAVRDAARTEPDAIRALAGGTVQERWFAGAAAFEDHDGARVLALIGDDSLRVRGIAATLAPIACDDDQAEQALRVAWSVRRERRLLRRLAAHGRQVPIDRFLGWLATEGHARELIDDLPFGSDGAVRRRLATALERPSWRLWGGLAGHHPQVLAEVLLARWQAARTESSAEADPLTRILVAKYHRILADRVPSPALALCAAQLASGVRPDATVWRMLLRGLPRETLQLAIAHDAPLPDGALADRANRLPAELLAEVVREAPHVLGPLGAWFRKLSPDRRTAMAEAWRATRDRPRWEPRLGTWFLAELPPNAARDEAFDAWSRASRDAAGKIDPSLVGALPKELAAIEARRHLHEVVALGTDPVTRLRGLARFLPWDEAGTAVATWVGHPEGEMRAVALRERLACPGIWTDDPRLPAAALELVLARQFEQDPVRQAMLDTLASWPRRVWRAEHLPAVATAIRHALDAADCSYGTAAAAERLVVRLFRVDPAWAATWLGTLVKERGTVHDPRLGAKLSDADVRAASPHLLKVASSWATNERVPWLVAFASSLGARLVLVDGLPALVATVRDRVPWEYYALQLTQILAHHARELHDRTLPAALDRWMKSRWYASVMSLAEADGLQAGHAQRSRWRRRPVVRPVLVRALERIARELIEAYSPQAVHLLRTRAPEAFDALLPELLRKDASAVCLPDVHPWLHRHRQDLLDPYLGDKPVKGRWATGKTRWILPYRTGFFRWTPPQVEQFADALGTIVLDRDRDTPAVLSALSVWPEMEYADPQRLIDRVADERPAVAERAVRVLARCDAGQGVPALLAALDTPLARFAIYGLRRALFAMMPDRAVELLAGVPLRKVTVAKEAIRLLGELRTPKGYARLLALSAEKLHRDVRIALLRALWDHLDREDTWAIYAAAVRDPDWVVASRLGDIPADRLTVATDRRLSELLGLVVDRPEPEARIDLLTRARALAVVDRERTFLAACRSRLRSVLDDEVGAAVDAVMARSTETDVPALDPVLRSLDPRMLHVAGGRLLAYAVADRASWKRAAAVLLDVAKADPRWSGLAIRAGAAHLPVDALCALIEALPLDPDALQAVFAAVRALPAADRPAAAKTLADSPREEVRRVAVAALEADVAARGWTITRVKRLKALRNDGSPAVAGAAARVWPPREDDPGF